MVRFIPSVVLGVYAVVTLATGNWGASVCALTLATVLLIADKHYIENQEVENLWDTIRLMQSVQHQVGMQADDAKNEVNVLRAQVNARVGDLESSVKARIGDLAVEVSKNKKSDDLWSEQ